MHRHLIRTLRQAGQLLRNSPFTTVPYLSHGVSVLEITTAIFGECPTVIVARKIWIRQQTGHIIRTALFYSHFQGIQNTGFPNPVGTRLDTVYFRRVKSTSAISFFQTNQVLLIIKKILVCIYGFIPCHRQVVCLCRQCLISSNIQSQTIHTKLQRFGNGLQRIVLDLAISHSRLCQGYHLLIFLITFLAMLLEAYFFLILRLCLCDILVQSITHRNSTRLAHILQCEITYGRPTVLTALGTHTDSSRAADYGKVHRVRCCI